MKLFKSMLFKNKNHVQEDILTSNDTIVVKARTTLQKFCRLGSSRPRATLYDFLEKELDIKLSTSHTTKFSTKEHPRFECTNKDEFYKETYKVIMKLKAKDTTLGQQVL